VVSKTTRLTELLHELDELLEELGAPFLSHALPGIGDDEIDALLAPSGIVAPTELREWWRWHHGARADSPLTDHHTVGPGSWSPMDIPEALWDREDWIETLGPYDGWPPGWLPFAGAMFDQGRLVARLEESTRDQVCVGWWYVFDVPPDEPVANSIAEVVENFISILREGQIVWRKEGAGYWEEGSRRTEFPRYLGL